MSESAIRLSDYIKGTLYDNSGEYPDYLSNLSNKWVKDYVVVTSMIHENPDVFTFSTDGHDVPLMGFVLDSTIFLNEDQSEEEMFDTLMHEINHLIE
jgi:hypothetical protein